MYRLRQLPLRVRAHARLLRRRGDGRGLHTRAGVHRREGRGREGLRARRRHRGQGGGRPRGSEPSGIHQVEGASAHRDCGRRHGRRSLRLREGGLRVQHDHRQVRVLHPVAAGGRAYERQFGVLRPVPGPARRRPPQAGREHGPHKGRHQLLRGQEGIRSDHPLGRSRGLRAGRVIHDDRLHDCRHGELAGCGHVEEGDGRPRLPPGEGGHRPQGREAGPVRRRLRRVQLADLRQAQRGGRPRRALRGPDQRAAVQGRAVLHRPDARFRRGHRDAGQVLQGGEERRGPRQVEGPRQGHPCGAEARGHRRGRAAARPVVGVQEEVLRQDYQPGDRPPVQHGHGQRRHGREGLRRGRRRVHVLHQRVRQEGQTQQGDGRSGRHDDELHVRAKGRRLMEEQI